MIEQKLTGYPLIDKPQPKYCKDKPLRRSSNSTASVERYSQKLPYKLLLFISRPHLAYTPILLNDYCIDRDRPVIFACNHACASDVLAAVTALRRHCYILVGYQNSHFLDKLYFFLNGSFYVDRKGPENGRLVKQALAKHLQKGKALLWFPEGTWNLSAELPVLPIKWGIAEVAKSANAQILPMALEYDRDTMKCYVKFGEPLSGDDLAERASAAEKLRDRMATLRWGLWEYCGPAVYMHHDLQRLRDRQYVAIDEYPPFDLSYERSVTYEPFASPRKVWAAIAEIEHITPANAASVAYACNLIDDLKKYDYQRSL